ncbi:hypothetical protein CCH79_00010024 [Gambusia affinis]|uniref:Inactive serine protease PAMR1 n=1 Tax=Gambusia affinis TaxID=33528 RepID=A0A315VZE9_GAMAF|nr:hypothetical protein CCH79_00010024 [Gambusia affinis]
MLSAGQEQQQGQTHRSIRTIRLTNTFMSRREGWLLSFSLIFISLPLGTAGPYDYRYLYNHCPGPEWSVMCRGCCEYDVIRCKCPLQGTQVGYAVPCCRNAINECDPCIIHPGCSIFENCKRCNNGTWGPQDNFFINGKYCAECRPGWSGGDCMKCGGVIRKRQGHLVLESYPNNARCEWTIQVEKPFTIEIRFMMLSLEFHPSCRYDFVEVRDGDSINSRVIGRFCGNNRPAALKSSGNTLHILFVSDGYKNFDGFFATFQENSACSSSPCLHDGTCILDTSYTYHCACLAGYTGKRCENVVGCHRPPVPKHGSTEGLFLHSGSRITYRCDPGFELQGFRTAICLTDGTWSATAPECVPVERVCTLPPKPVNGDHLLVYGPNDVLIALQYMCNQPYELIGISQRTCLPNNTWSGTPPVCSKVNNTLTESEKDKNKVQEADTDRGVDIESEKDNRKIKEIPQQNTTEKGSAGREDIYSWAENTTSVDTEDKYTETVPENSVNKDTDEGDLEETNTGSERPSEDKKIEVDPKSTDSRLNTVEEKESAGPKPPEKKEERSDPEPEKGKVNPTEVVPKKDKGQEEKERKEEQINGRRNPDKFGPNDTKLKTNVSEGDTTVETFELDLTKNSTYSLDSKDAKKENNTTGSPTTVRKIDPSRINVTQYTLYRANGENGKTKEKSLTTEDETGKDSLEKTKELERRKEDREKDKEKGGVLLFLACTMATTRWCQGWIWKLWSLCATTHMLSAAIKGEPVSQMVPGVAISPSVSEHVENPKYQNWSSKKFCRLRKTIVHRLLSSAVNQKLQSVGPTKSSPVLPQLSQGFHHLYTHIEYECASQYYHHFGSARRTCLKTGKWSGRHVSCSPVCGKHVNFDPERPEEAHWPWLAAIYRRSLKETETKVTKARNQDETLKEDAGDRSRNLNQASDWQLVCSGALVNQRSLVVAAHCVTELGKMYPVDTATIKVVVGKHYRNDRRENKGPQHLRVSSIAVHPNYDPYILDSDIAVIKLLDKARIGEKVLPLCLSENEEEEVTSDQGLVTGWSPLQDSSLGLEEKARVGLVHLADIVPCEQQYARNGVPVSVTDNMLCASQKPDYGPSNICPSDTGGILVLPANSGNQVSYNSKSFQVQKNNKGLWRLLGLVSFGYDQGECDPELYTVYTRVANFKDWIESNIK